ncbi:nickel pincer cofactor biosynthesis protein LarB [Staphylococcus devriesei]|uniref:Nickel pincer cofactor biosynthesis protein LarB n=1 Tax=Staphylococcus devriesei TaxID=586733 RepID=A0A2K4DQN3_9STAP|nr:nickel pincer cofactor biosynthesis protein LarB [Staphylococcus devriesei]MCE5090659.1 nickel pincer cofactor biosynthesis protein LarB [Staphylococcus devriesei]MCE5096787.1 nickel pincer cofactor biosynthesis protein LarB [Staphylococcus devriesei]PNZ89118.1 1-(5-phosphoribosyl)-5-amino-4-imidazole-carboxylate carboxylase [Staphylococcus devriesei]PTF05182.1 nickel pincer cofactor biosynthesis protein LarB [Staphylococcus devriesei]PTF14561.1 nickel pincer cofactor biosynthesis protein L
MSKDPSSIEDLLESVKSNQISIDEAKAQLSHYDELGFAKIDLHRAQRQGFPEVIFGQGKTKEQIVKIITSLLHHNNVILVTRIDQDKATYVLEHHPNLAHYAEANIVCTPLDEIEKSEHYISVLCAGTSDLPIAEEAAITAEVMGIQVKRFYDVGVSGIHRLFAHIQDIRHGKVSIVIAGMEGALSSVVGGLVDHPVYAVPTSVGYGANLDGITTLLSMINSCAPGTSVLNIDNGFGAGYNAAMIINMLENT